MLGSFSFEVENPVGTDRQDISDTTIDPILEINVSDIALIESQMMTVTENNTFLSSDITMQDLSKLGLNVNIDNELTQGTGIETSDSNNNDTSEAILMEKLIQKKEEDFVRLLRLVGSNFVYKAKGGYL